MSRTFLNTPAITRALTIIVPVITVLAVIQLLIGGAIELGLKRYNLDLLTHENPPAFATLFSRFSIWGRAFGLRFMTTLLTFLWSLLFIVPGIIASYRYALAPYLMAENPDMDVMEAIARSKELMDGNKGRLFCLQLAFNFVWTLLFFQVRNYALSFFWLTALWGLIVWMTLSFYERDRLAAWLQIPYLVWVLLAGYLNFGVWMLNR